MGFVDGAAGESDDVVAEADAARGGAADGEPVVLRKGVDGAAAGGERLRGDGADDHDVRLGRLCGLRECVEGCVWPEIEDAPAARAA